MSSSEDEIISTLRQLMERNAKKVVQQIFPNEAISTEQLYGAESKFELAPIHITCEVTDIAVISAPVVNSKEALYYLYKPNGDALRLAHFTKPKAEFTNVKVDFTKPEANFTKPKGDFANPTTTSSTTNHFYFNKYEFTDYDEIIVKYINKDIKTIYPQRNYKVINANFAQLQSRSNNFVDEIENEMKETDFMMGPLSEEYQGNWVLSVYCKDVDDTWIEVFQVITIQLIETVPMVPKKIELEEGTTFNLRFAYPIKGLQSCELTAPRSSFDRYFDRNRIELDICGYVVPNVTKSDEGIWSVIGVGKIIYEGIVNLSVINKVT